MQNAPQAADYKYIETGEPQATHTRLTLFEEKRFWKEGAERFLKDNPSNGIIYPGQRGAALQLYTTTS